MTESIEKRPQVYLGRYSKMTKHRCFTFQWFVFCVLALAAPYTVLYAKENGFIHFDTTDLGKPDDKVPVIQPWKTIALEPQYGGQWVVACTQARVSYNQC